MTNPAGEGLPWACRSASPEGFVVEELAGAEPIESEAVSYTHLTLPTIYSV